MSKVQQIDIDPNILYSTKIYSLHNAIKGGRDYLAKVFYEKNILQQLNLDCFEYNQEIFANSKQFLYPNYFLSIADVYPHSQGFLFLITPYQCKLNQFIEKKKLLPESQALQIFSQILKAMASLFYAGYWHRHLRPEHFVKVGQTWKIESLVFDHLPGIKKLKSQYLWSEQLQCPQFIHNDEFTDEQFDEKIVWDLGCILIFMIYGDKATKSTVAENKFKEQGYSPQLFDYDNKIKVSAQTKQYLSQMCHIDPTKRLKFIDLLKIDFFSEALAKLAVSYDSQKKHSKIFIRNKSAVSRTLEVLKKDPKSIQVYDTSMIMKKMKQKQIKNLSKISEQVGEEESMMPQKKEETLKVYQNLDNERQKSEIRNSYISCISEERYKKYSQIVASSLEKIFRLEEIHYDGLGKHVLEYYKRNIEKCQLLSVTSQKIELVKKIISNEERADKMILMTNYTLNFVGAIQLSEIEDTYKNKEFITQYSDEENQDFYSFKQFKELRKIIEFKKNNMFANLAKIQKRLQKFSFDDELHFCKFLGLNAQYCPFSKVKGQYRKIMKKIYDIVTRHYTEDKDKKWAEIGIFLTFSVCIDKLCKRKYFVDNFLPYFEWSKNEKKQYIPLLQIENFVKDSRKSTLVKYSRQLIIKFFEL